MDMKMHNEPNDETRIKSPVFCQTPCSMFALCLGDLNYADIGV